MTIDTGWLDLPASVSDDEVRLDKGVAVTRITSRYESPRQVRAIHDTPTRTLTIEFRYFGGPEATRHVRFSGVVDGEVGKHSHRIYSLVFNPVSAEAGFQTMIERAVSDLQSAIESARFEVSEDNSQATNNVISRVVKPELPKAAMAAG